MERLERNQDELPLRFARAARAVRSTKHESLYESFTSS